MASVLLAGVEDIRRLTSTAGRAGAREINTVRLVGAEDTSTDEEKWGDYMHR